MRPKLLINLPVHTMLRAEDASLSVQPARHRPLPQLQLNKASSHSRPLADGDVLYQLFLQRLASIEKQPALEDSCTRQETTLPSCPGGATSSPCLWSNTQRHLKGSVPQLNHNQRHGCEAAHGEHPPDQGVAAAALAASLPCLHSSSSRPFSSTNSSCSTRPSSSTSSGSGSSESSSSSTRKTTDNISQMPLQGVAAQHNQALVTQQAKFAATSSPGVPRLPSWQNSKVDVSSASPSSNIGQHSCSTSSTCSERLLVTSISFGPRAPKPHGMHGFVLRPSSSVGSPPLTCPVLPELRRTQSRISSGRSPSQHALHMSSSNSRLASSLNGTLTRPGSHPPIHAQPMWQQQQQYARWQQDGTPAQQEQEGQIDAQQLAEQQPQQEEQQLPCCPVVGPLQDLQKHNCIPTNCEGSSGPALTFHSSNDSSSSSNNGSSGTTNNTNGRISYTPALQLWTTSSSSLINAASPPSSTQPAPEVKDPAVAAAQPCTGVIRSASSATTRPLVPAAAGPAQALTAREARRGLAAQEEGWLAETKVVAPTGPASWLLQQHEAVAACLLDDLRPLLQSGGPSMHCLKRGATGKAGQQQQERQQGLQQQLKEQHERQQGLQQQRRNECILETCFAVGTGTMSSGTADTGPIEAAARGLGCSTARITAGSKDFCKAADEEYVSDQTCRRQDVLAELPDGTSSTGAGKMTAAGAAVATRSRRDIPGALGQQKPEAATEARLGPTEAGNLALTRAYAAVASQSGPQAGNLSQANRCQSSLPVKTLRVLQLLPPAFPGVPPTIAFIREVASIAAESLKDSPATAAAAEGGASPAVAPVAGAMATGALAAEPGLGAAPPAHGGRPACKQASELILLPSVRLLVKYDGVANKPVKAVSSAPAICMLPYLQQG